MIEDGEQFFRRHPDPETRQRGLLLVAALRQWRAVGSAFVPLDPALTAPGPQTLAQSEKQAIERALNRANHRRKEAGRALDISTAALRRLIKKHSIQIK